ncbi:dienelactone hydrolase family protein [Cryptosporangium sp. NPDC051539]|uniref:dienelactone hydrolase family protein n=1 Tax=Cryptosporangium sp. NPDC051539 TaxID=3363962 RepID=UPI00379BC03A
MIGDLRAATVRITGASGDEIEAYLARPEDDGPRGSVVVIHHMPGYDAPSKEITRTFAANGYTAICPNLYSREAPGADPDDAAAAARASGGVPDDRLVGDVAAAAAYLRGLPGSNGKVGTIGYCSGGRQSFLAALEVDVDAAVDCYGAFVVGTPPDGFPLRMTPLVQRAPELRCPLLGLFGNEDKYPTPEHVDELEKALTEAGKPFEFHRYDNAGHAFFAVDRPSYRPEAAVDGWKQIWKFYGTHLGA